MSKETDSVTMVKVTGSDTIREAASTNSVDENINKVITDKTTGTYQCHVCPWIFNSATSLQKHTKTHTAPKPYKCQQCPKQFISKSGLNNHHRQHTGERP